MSAFLTFSSSDAFVDAGGTRGPVEVPVDDYVEGTYGELRCGPDGEVVASLVDGAWELADGRRFSDWAISVAGSEGVR